MSLAIICTNKDSAPWVSALKTIDPTLDVQVWPHADQRQGIEFALCWKHPRGVLQHYPDLRCICSMGAGIDHILNDPDRPQHVPVVRVVDPLLAHSMFEYIHTCVMYFFRDFDLYRRQQAQTRWVQQPPRLAGDITIGIMGLGELGSYAARQLAASGFRVTGWSRRQKSITDVETYSGDQQLKAFLSRSDILVCLLPLTDQTTGILNLELFSMLPQGACIINVARGEHLMEKDLLAALDSGQLRGACLDVFREEPLPADHPFWTTPQITLTPHCSCITEPTSVAPQIVDNYRRLKNREPLRNQVDLLRGY